MGALKSMMSDSNKIKLREVLSESYCVDVLDFVAEYIAEVTVINNKKDSDIEDTVKSVTKGFEYELRDQVGQRT